VTLGQATSLLREGILQVLFLASPLLLTAMVVGLVIAILQATTSIQEQTLTFVPKVFAILLILGFLGGWMFTSLSNFTQRVFSMIPEIVR
jgi:flagellar biosynthetic protein FliQ